MEAHKQRRNRRIHPKILEVVEKLESAVSTHVHVSNMHYMYMLHLIIHVYYQTSFELDPLLCECNVMKCEVGGL